MSQTVLSKLQVIAVGMTYTANLFTEDDLAHLSHCELKLAETTLEENALVADLAVYFRDWSYLDHKESTHPADAMPAEVRIVFFQDEQRRLTGLIRLGFIAEDPIVEGRLEYLRGW